MIIINRDIFNFISFKAEGRDLQLFFSVVCIVIFSPKVTKTQFHFRPFYFFRSSTRLTVPESQLQKPELDSCYLLFVLLKNDAVGFAVLGWSIEWGGFVWVGGVRLGFDLETLNFLESQDLDISIISPLVSLCTGNTAESAHLISFDDKNVFDSILFYSVLLCVLILLNACRNCYIIL